MEALAIGFKKYHPEAMMATNFMTSSEGAIAAYIPEYLIWRLRVTTRRFTDMMPFYGTFHYLPTEISNRHRRSRKSEAHFGPR